MYTSVKLFDEKILYTDDKEFFNKLGGNYNIVNNMIHIPDTRENLMVNNIPIKIVYLVEKLEVKTVCDLGLELTFVHDGIEIVVQINQRYSLEKVNG